MYTRLSAVHAHNHSGCAIQTPYTIQVSAHRNHLQFYQQQVKDSAYLLEKNVSEL